MFGRRCYIPEQRGENEENDDDDDVDDDGDDDVGDNGDDDVDGDNDDDDGDEKEFYPFSRAADPRSAAVIDLLPGFNMSHKIIMIRVMIRMSHKIRVRMWVNC